MVDLIAIKGAVDGIKAARDIAKTAIGLRDAALLQSKVIEMNDAIMSAQSSALDAQAEQLALVQRINDLEQKLMSLEAWEAEKQRYQLTDFGSGTFAYLLKPEMSAGEPPHRICAHCYQQGHKSILQYRYTSSSSQDFYRCPGCKVDFQFGNRSSPQIAAESEPL